MSEIELLPCPFCGAPGALYRCVAGDGFWAWCSDTGCRVGPRTPRTEDADEAAEIWNTRYAPGGGFDAPRYRRICSALEGALQDLTEWGCAE